MSSRRDDVERALKDREESKGAHTVPVRIAARYVEAGADRRGGGGYVLTLQMGRRRAVRRPLDQADGLEQGLGGAMSAPRNIGSALLALAEIAILLRAILRPHREPASRLAWVVVIVVLPIVGIVAYLLLGEIRISNAPPPTRPRDRPALPTPDADEESARKRSRRAITPRRLRWPAPSTGSARPAATRRGSPPTATSRSTAWSRTSTPRRSTSICAPTSGWRTITAARSRMRVIRAAARGVKVRAMADALGSRLFIRSGHWRELVASGADVRVALPVGNPLVDYHPRPGRPAQPSQAH